MSSIIDGRQFAFIEGKHLLHGVLIANEVVEEARKRKKPCMVFKVDYEVRHKHWYERKDFICVNWL